MKTQIFGYKGNLGTFTDIENGTFINDPSASEQLGCVISIDEIEINQEAIDILKTATHTRGSFSSIMLTKHLGNVPKAYGLASIGFMGVGKQHFGKNIIISRDCDKSILNNMTPVEFEVPSDYKAFINDQI
jgi:hypothetical protein